MEDSALVQFSGGPPQLSARGPRTWPTGSQFLRGTVRGGLVGISSSAAGSSLATRETEVTLFTDASSSGWGAQFGSYSTQGLWSASQRSCHINVLEMQAVMKAFLPHLRSPVVRLMYDNAVTVAYIKKKGGLDPTLSCS